MRKTELKEEEIKKRFEEMQEAKSRRAKKILLRMFLFGLALFLLVYGSYYIGAYSICDGSGGTMLGSLTAPSSWVCYDLNDGCDASDCLQFYEPKG